MKLKATPSLFLACTLLFNGCMTSMPKNKYHAHSRSSWIQDDATEQAILARATLNKSDNADLNHIRVLTVRGTPYEMGFQHGRLMKEDVQENIERIYKRVSLLVDPEVLDEVYAQIDPYIPIEDKMELLGLAHGADLPIRVLQRVHAIPELSEYKHKKQYSKKRMLATSCSNVAAFGDATVDNQLYSIRVLDWVRELGAQAYATVVVYHPNEGNKYSNFGYAGFIGSITGMNDQGMTFGEMGYGDLPEETLSGIPFVFLFKKLMREASTLEEALEITRNAQRTCSYGYLFTDAKINDAVLVISNRDEMLTFKHNQTLEDEESLFPAIPQVVYGGAKDEMLYEELSRFQGKIGLDAFKTIAKSCSLKSNMQVVIMKPGTSEAWIANAADSSFVNPRDDAGRACNRDYFHVDLKTLFAD